MHTVLSCGVKCHDSVSRPRAFALVRHSEALVHASVQVQLMTLRHAYCNKQANTGWKDGWLSSSEGSEFSSQHPSQTVHNCL